MTNDAFRFLFFLIRRNTNNHRVSPQLAKRCMKRAVPRTASRDVRPYEKYFLAGGGSRVWLQVSKQSDSGRSDDLFGSNSATSSRSVLELDIASTVLFGMWNHVQLAFIFFRHGDGIRSH